VLVVMLTCFVPPTAEAVVVDAARCDRFGVLLTSLHPLIDRTPLEK